MSDLRKAAEMALNHFDTLQELNDAEYAIMKALRQALAMENFSEISQEIEEALKQPKREWVGLTDEERADCWSSSAVQSAINIEAKLKEKNR